MTTWRGNEENVAAHEGQAYWDDRSDPLAWDTLILGDEIWPGVAEVSGAGVSRKIDVKKAKDSDGATLKDEGYELARLTITLTIYSEADWVELQRLLPKVHPRNKGGVRVPTSIVYPSVNLLGINQIYIDKIPIPQKPRSEDGILSVELSAIEWVPEPPPAKGAGAGTASDGTGPGGYGMYDPTDPTTPWYDAHQTDDPQGADEYLYPDSDGFWDTNSWV